MVTSDMGPGVLKTFGLCLLRHSSVSSISIFDIDNEN